VAVAVAVAVIRPWPAAACESGTREQTECHTANITNKHIHGQWGNQTNAMRQSSVTKDILGQEKQYQRLRAMISDKHILGQEKQYQRLTAIISDKRYP
jgi:hypothetical protein